MPNLFARLPCDKQWITCHSLQNMSHSKAHEHKTVKRTLCMRSKGEQSVQILGFCLLFLGVTNLM